MPDYKAPLDDMRFLLHDVFHISHFCQRFPAFTDIDEDTVNAILEEAAKVSEQVLAPLDTKADAAGARWQDGHVYAPEGFHEAYKTFNEGAWGGLGGDPEYDGMGMPKLLVSAVEEMVQGANMAFGLAPMLTAGACLALQAHGSESLKRQYLPKMYSGQWSGAMDLTEAHSGSDLGLMRTKAVPEEGKDSYRISGSKIFITWGEHDLAENIIHLVLAKLPDAPEGSRGISLFLVPKFTVDEAGTLGENNGVHCGSIEHKMGIHGSPTCVMNFDDAVGWLVGEPNQGLACMFTMMNYERLVVGIQGIGVAENAYQTARDYALERLQGRAPGSDKSGPADPIIRHPDVKRMLLEVKSMNEASRAFYFYVARCLDTAKHGDEHDIVDAKDRVSLLTPIAKAFMTDRAFEACVVAQQVLGGHGYIAEWGQEQKVRDVRITQIYEGTNGIQAMDLIGRKTISNKGALLSAYIEDVRQDLAVASQKGVDDSVAKYCREIIARCEVVTAELVAADCPNLPGAVAVDYLDLLGYLAFAHMWLLMLTACEEASSVLSADQISTKKTTAMFFYRKMLPKSLFLESRIREGAEPLLLLPDALF